MPNGYINYKWPFSRSQTVTNYQRVVVYDKKTVNFLNSPCNQCSWGNFLQSHLEASSPTVQAQASRKCSPNRVIHRLNFCLRILGVWSRPRVVTMKDYEGHTFFWVAFCAVPIFLAQSNTLLLVISSWSLGWFFFRCHSCLKDFLTGGWL